MLIGSIIFIVVVYDRKDTNFWKQFTTGVSFELPVRSLFMTAKIQIFESNSQHCVCKYRQTLCCLWPQRYKFLKAIHNSTAFTQLNVYVVYDRKDTNFWKQFTTMLCDCRKRDLLFMTAKIQIFESNSQLLLRQVLLLPVVYDRKDTNFWKQFTTKKQVSIKFYSCLWPQRYKFLKAIHNLQAFAEKNSRVVYDRKDTNFWKQFTTPESKDIKIAGCLWPQRYKFLKAIHN